jgi:hypothetical protein
MKKILLLTIAGTVTLFACKSSGSGDKKSVAGVDSKTTELANGICDCMGMLEKELSADAKKLFMEGAASSDPKKAMQEAVMNLPTDKQMSIGMEMMKLAGMKDESKGVGECMKKLKEKYDDVKKLDNDKARMQQMVTVLEAQKCDFAAAFMKIALQEMGNR